MSTKTRRKIAQLGQLAGFVLTIILMLSALQPVTLAITMMHPKRMPINTAEFTPSHMGLAYREISFEASDGILLEGWLIEPQGQANDRAIIVSHAYENNRVLGMWHAFTLAQAGYTVLVYDHRAHGESEGETSGLGWAEDRDVLGAVSFLKAQGANWIGAAGLSLGATASLRAAAQSEEIRAVWADGAGGVTLSDNLPPCNLHEALTTPSWAIFYIAHGLLSGLPRPAPMLETLAEIAPRPTTLVIAGQSKVEACTNQRWGASDNQVDIWVIETGHISGMETHRDEYQQRLVAFFDGAFGSESE